MVVTEELELDLIRVASYPDSIFKYHLIYKAGNATGVVGVYSFDEEWYYLYKKDTEKFKVKRRKDLEGIKPSFTYKQQWKRHIDQHYKQKLLNGKKAKVAEIGDENTAAAVVKENTSTQIQSMKVDVKIGSVHPIGSIRAIASVNLNDCFAIRNVKIIYSSEGLLVSMPSYKEDGVYKDICFPVTEAFRQQLNDAVINAYQQVLEMNNSQEPTRDDPTFELPEQTDLMQMSSM